MQFDDRRSRRLVLVAHCVLNQNAKLDRCAHYPGAMTEVVRLLVDSGAGIVQMPCPEMVCLGLERGATDASASVAAEDTRIRHLMGSDEAVAACRRISTELADLVRDYRANGFEVCGVLGINGSPTCGVETNWEDGEERNGLGIFTRELERALTDAGDNLPMRGVRAYEPATAVSVVELLLGRT